MTAPYETKLLNMIDQNESIEIGNDIKLSYPKYTALLQFLLARIDQQQPYRCQLISRFTRLDEQMAGKNYLDNSRATAQRKENEKRGTETPLPHINLNVTHDKLDEIATTLTSMLFPTEKFYSTTATKDKLNASTALSKQLSREAQQFKHYTAYRQIVLSALRYNVFGAVIEWKTIKGKKAVKSADGEGVTFQNAPIFAGNHIKPIDPYNVVWDMSVAMHEVSTHGEYLATFERRSLFQLRRDEIAGATFGPKKYRAHLKSVVRDFAVAAASERTEDLDDSLMYISEYAKNVRYHEHCDNSETATGDDVGTGQLTVNNVGAFLGEAGATARGQSGMGTAEVTRIFIKLNPRDFGLVDRKAEDTTETWYFEIVNDSYIIFAERVDAQHERLPCFFGSFNSTDAKHVERAVSEVIQPIQNSMNALFNLHLNTLRKNLRGGTKLYNKSVIDEAALREDGTGTVAVKMAAFDEGDVRKHYAQFSDVNMTNGTLPEMQALLGLVDNMVPAGNGKSVNDLQRATQYQAQSAVHESNKRPLALARLFDDQGLSDARFIMYYNQLQHRSEFNGIDDEGKPETFTAADMLDVEFTLGNGLRSIDQFSVLQVLKDAINFTIQAQLQDRGVDVLGLVDHYTSLAGDESDLSRFMIEHPIDALTDDAKTIAMQLLEQAQQQEQQQGPTQ